MNCQEALDLLYEIIDKEASEIDSQEVKRHLDHCHDCFGRYQLHGAIQSLIVEKLKVDADISVIERMRGNILNKLDEIDSEREFGGSKTVPFRIPAVVLAAAAALLLLVGTGFFASGLYQHYTEYIPIERAHWAANENVDIFRDSDKTASIMTAVSRDFGLTMSPAHNGLKLVGGTSREIRGRQVSQFYYSNGEYSASVFVIPASEISFSDDLIETKITIEGNCFYDHNCRGCRLLYTKNGDAVIITASTDRDYELTAFNPVVRVI